jgi:hypothetical protein
MSSRFPTFATGISQPDTNWCFAARAGVNMDACLGTCAHALAQLSWCSALDMNVRRRRGQTSDHLNRFALHLQCLLMADWLCQHNARTCNVRVKRRQCAAIAANACARIVAIPDI